MEVLELRYTEEYSSPKLTKNIHARQSHLK